MQTRTKKNSGMKEIYPISQIPTNHNGHTCPQCQSSATIKAGIDNHVQRYKCKQCGLNFRSTTGTALQHIHKKQKIEQYINCMLSNMTLRATAKEIGISLGTAFAWRHKLAQNINTRQYRTAKQSIQISIIKLPYSNKGTRTKQKRKLGTQPNLLLSDANGLFQLIELPPTNRFINATLAISTQAPYAQTIEQNEKTFLGRIINSRPTNRNHKSNSKKSDEIIEWLAKFRGVATKYIQNYWNWYLLKDMSEKYHDNSSHFFNEILSSRTSYIQV